MRGADVVSSFNKQRDTQPAKAKPCVAVRVLENYFFRGFEICILRFVTS